MNKGRYALLYEKENFTLAAVVTLPFILLVMYLLASMASYSNTYSEIVSNMTVANNYNLNFKEEMDESLYKLVVGYVTLDNIESDKSLKNPYVLIEELRSEFTRLTAITTESESKLWLESLLRNINALEKRVDDIVDSIDAGGRYSENIEMLDNNIYILTELIQDDIQYYIYYQTRYMEKVTDTLQKTDWTLYGGVQHSDRGADCSSGCQCGDDRFRNPSAHPAVEFRDGENCPGRFQCQGTGEF